MKIVVFSDTHRRISGAERIIRREQPDLILHLGDHIQDARELAELFPQIPMESVPGNCDWMPDAPDCRLLRLEGLTLMITHGHPDRVKYDLTPQLNAAYFQGAQMVLFGHTHQPLNTLIQGLYVVNPGSAGTGDTPTWARILLQRGQDPDIAILPI